MATNHPVHRLVTDFIEDSIKGTGFVLERDSACGGIHTLPLYLENDEKSQKMCNADLLIRDDKNVRVVVEIEESNDNPIHICGKVLASAISKAYVYEKESFPIRNAVFIQIVYLVPKEGSIKEDQLLSMANELKIKVPQLSTQIRKYFFCAVITENSLLVQESVFRRFLQNNMLMWLRK